MNYKKLAQTTTAADVDLVAVSKTYSAEHILPVYKLGQKDFGENKVQEMMEKYEAMPKDIRWHLIGHLQTNKVKYIASFVHLIHSVDSIKLAKEINKQASKNGRTIDCLLQLKVASEDSKFGLNTSSLGFFCEELLSLQLDNIRIRGLMGMATFTDDKEQIRAEFKRLKSTFDSARAKYFSRDNFNTLSMGMSGDYQIAIEEGSTMIRVGSLIFGARLYQ